MSLHSQHLSSEIIIDGTIVHIRPIKNSDLANEKKFVEHLSPESRHYRFLGGVTRLSDESAKSLCEIDYDTQMAFIAVIKDSNGEELEIGVSRYATDHGGECEFALTVADEWQNKGVGKILMNILIEFAQSKGKTNLYSIDLAENVHMRELAKDLGMKAQHDSDDPCMMRYELAL